MGVSGDPPTRTITGWNAVDAALAEAIAARRSELGRTIIVGIAGAQGSGKTTLLPRIAAMLSARGFRPATLALDDFYLTKAQRLALATSVHPLLATRGVPGTHDTALLGATLDALLEGSASVSVPRFDKVTDDRALPREVPPPVDIVLLEGWCIGAGPQPQVALAEPVNALERDEDPDGKWRCWVNEQLSAAYARLFARLDLQIFLRAPDFAVVEHWRAEQEAGLGNAAMEAGELRRFVAHYERITRAMLADHKAGLTVRLDAGRQPFLRTWRDAK